MNETATVRCWKIAPGDNAKFWDDCRHGGYVCIAGLDGTDLSQYKSQQAIKDALIANGRKGGFSLSMWRFLNDVGPGDVVVANKGQNRVMGVGVVRSDYIPPGDPRNPRRTYSQIRKVEWLASDPLTMPPEFFGGGQPPTVRELTDEQWQAIKHAYVQASPALAATLAKLPVKSTREGKIVNTPDQSADALQAIAERTRNVLLYGPPGTGKTWRVTRFAKHLIKASWPAPQNLIHPL